ncbi:hypothetical protein ACJRO7_035021 [Eucalyptus globulus]|uniref:Uncharacterized protein n=1 Tax=Eucalyptus globulus TaxID=34317 RepID=A0ABD3J7S9_EUCGL
MELKSFAEGKRDARHSKCRGPKGASIRSNASVVEAITRARAGGLDVSVSQVREDGAVRMKLVVRKEELKHILEAIKGGRKKSAHQAATSGQPLSGEQRLHLLWRRKFVKDGRPRSSWEPALQSIPEELQVLQP